MSHPNGRASSPTSPRCAAPSRAAPRRATRSRWFPPWARCMTAILRWCGWRAGARGASWCRSSSIRRSLRRTRTSRAIRATSSQDLAALAEAGVDLVWAPDIEGDVSGRLRDPHRARRAGQGRPRGRVPPAFLRRRRDRGRQAPDPVRARRGGLRREGLPAAQGDHAARRRSRSAGQDRRRADRAREERPRDVVAQRLPHATRSAASPRRCIACSRIARARIAARNRSRACSTKAPPRSKAWASRSTIWKRATPTAWQGARRSRTGRSDFWSPARLGATRLIDNVAV